ncbi:SDR family NAD(P)-dependent oxidoreductase [Novosphingobium lentum]|uniref:SDR family NAD(P)-dependent oxidoreductase n=1 Tax=Novosphingobium lentum TaxID=145287 RepID=UPI000837421F|nr:SDR family oxidoreductase [Novosphingobium lentum]
MNRLEGKVAIVTGGAGGIGAATARRLAREGAKVLVADIAHEAAEAVAAAIGDAAHGYAFDAADNDSVEAMVEFAAQHFGRLDILHNNAAYVGADLARDSKVTDIPYDLWDKTMAINLRAYFVGCRFAIPHMARTGGGSIINTASGSAFLGDLARVAYGTSKGAVVSLTRYVATQHAAEGIRCNAIAPGLIMTPAFANSGQTNLEPFMKQILSPRVGTPDDVAAAVAYLASDEAGYITGTVLHVDGGLSAHQPYVADFEAMLAGG